MNQTEFEMYFHNTLFRLSCYEQRGTAFQMFFENIMERYDHTFLPVKPSGRQGDWKCDGFSQGTGTVYQCYAPDGITVEKAVGKIMSDFDGAKIKWGLLMKQWIFVWSDHQALPPQLVSTLQDLRNENPSIVVDDWGPHALWKIVEALPREDRVALLGPAPSAFTATEVTAAEVQTLLNFLVRRDISMLTDDLDLTDLTDKLDRNHLGDPARAMIRTALPVARVVEDYAKNHPDVTFSTIIAAALSERYVAIAATSDGDSDGIFGRLVADVCNGHLDQPKYYWAAVGIVTHYFQLCDVFER